MAHGMSVKSEFVDHIFMYDLESYDTCKVLGVKMRKKVEIIILMIFT